MIQFNGQTMGTSYQVKIYSESINDDEKNALKDEIDAALVEVNRQMSTYIPTSEISMFNSMYSSEPVKISDGFVEVLKLAKKIYQQSNGAFDVTVGPLVDLWGFGKEGSRTSPPTEQTITEILQHVGSDKYSLVGDTSILKLHPKLELDLGAIAKGFGVDVVANLLKKHGYNNYLVEIGGEVVVRGKKGNDFWRIGIDRPAFGAVPGQQLEAILNISDVAVATSGDYRNYFVSEDKTYSHTLNPKTGKPVVNGVASVTVIAPTCLLADAMATAIMVMGETKGLSWIEETEGIETLIILRENSIYRESISSGFKEFMVQ